VALPHCTGRRRLFAPPRHGATAQAFRPSYPRRAPDTRGRILPLEGTPGLPAIVATVRAVVETYEWPGAVSLEAVEDAERWARAHADALVGAR